MLQSASVTMAITEETGACIFVGNMEGYLREQLPKEAKKTPADGSRAHLLVLAELHP